MGANGDVCFGISDVSKKTLFLSNYLAYNFSGFGRFSVKQKAFPCFAPIFLLIFQTIFPNHSSPPQALRGAATAAAWPLPARKSAEGAALGEALKRRGVVAVELSEEEENILGEAEIWDEDGLVGLVGE